MEPRSTWFFEDQNSVSKSGQFCRINDAENHIEDMVKKTSPWSPDRSIYIIVDEG